jgi:hypothetical protein
MRLEEAFTQAKDEDTIYHPPLWGIEYSFKKKEMSSYSISGNLIFSRNWRIKKQEKETVWTMGKWLVKYGQSMRATIGFPDNVDKSDLLEACQFFQANGRLERDLEYRDLVKASQALLEHWKREITKYNDRTFQHLFNALWNLKPLKQED